MKDNFTATILQKLRLLISLKLLHSEDNIKIVYREVAKAKTPGMLLEAIKKLPEEERQNIRKIINIDERTIFGPLGYTKIITAKYINPKLSFKFSEGDLKRKQRLEALDRIRKSKLEK